MAKQAYGFFPPLSPLLPGERAAPGGGQTRGSRRRVASQRSLVSKLSCCGKATGGGLQVAATTWTLRSFLLLRWPGRSRASPWGWGSGSGACWAARGTARGRGRLQRQIDTTS
eukprot:184022-Prorocentrum_minimum.AAC.1